MKMSEALIVKVQLEQAPSKGANVLIYSEDRTVLYQQSTPRALRKRLGKRQKAYFYATLRGTILNLGNEAPEQEW
jgi:hypothetical protein